MGDTIDWFLESPFRFFTSATIVAVVVGTLSCNACNRVQYGDGVRAGMINKVSKKGVIWKTYEGQMALEGIAGSGGSLGANVWDFSIDGKMKAKDQEDMAELLIRYMSEGRKVKIEYNQQISPWPPRGNTDYYITKITPVVKSSPEKR